MIIERDFIVFKQRVEFFIKNRERDMFEAFQKQLGILKNNYLLIKGLIEEINVKEAADFNVFDILGLGHLEVRAHTPFLAELLNPRGSHGQGNLFLRRFFQFFDFLPLAEISKINWKVIKESESIDLRIVNYKLKKAIFIENKVYTDSHSGQLSRYYKKWRESFPNGGQFMYLTISGGQPDDAGFDDKVDPRFTKELIKREMRCISYKTHIKEWLEGTFPNIQATRVRETIHQYLHLIDNL